MAEIEIKISKKDFKITLEGQGYKGGKCIADINVLQQELKLLTVAETKKPELQVARTRIKQGRR